MNLAVALSFSLKFCDAKYSRIVFFLNLNLRVRCCHYSQKIRLRNYLFRIRIRQTSVQRYLAQVSCPYCLFYSVADPDRVGSGTKSFRICNTASFFLLFRILEIRPVGKIDVAFPRNKFETNWLLL